MKKFKFPLETVLKIKNQLHNALNLEYAEALSNVKRQEEVIKALENEYESVAFEFESKKMEGILPNQMGIYQTYFNVQHQKIKRAYKELKNLTKILDDKRDEIVESKKEIATIDNLKEKRLDEYNTMVRKNDELFIEEFVSNKSI